jgi:hypothetical protein
MYRVDILYKIIFRATLTSWSKFQPFFFFFLLVQENGTLALCLPICAKIDIISDQFYIYIYIYIYIIFLDQCNTLCGYLS